jgi:nicotinamide-nucleotide amidase
MGSRAGVEERLSQIVMAPPRAVAVAESLTGGSLSSCLARLPDAAEWFRGGVVAYSSAVKRDVLGVPDVPVVSEPAALALADGVARLLGADVAIAVTGVGGPEPQDGVEVGTVWMAVHDAEGTIARCMRFDGDPEAVVRKTCGAAIEWLAARLEAGTRG